MAGWFVSCDALKCGVDGLTGDATSRRVASLRGLGLGQLVDEVCGDLLAGHGLSVQFVFGWESHGDNLVVSVERVE